MENSNEITMATHPLTGAKTEVATDSTQVLEGGFGEKYIHTARVFLQRARFRKEGLRINQNESAPEKTRKVGLIERVFDTPDIVQHILEMWEKFRKAEIAVVPTLRLTNQGSLVETDLKVDGSEIYGKGTGFLDEGMEQRRQNGLSQTDQLFIERYPSLIEEISAAFNTLLKKADKAGLALPGDDPVVLYFRPNGEWQLMVLDLEQAATLGKGKYNSTNLNLAWQFRTDLSNTYKMLVDIQGQVT